MTLTPLEYVRPIFVKPKYESVFEYVFGGSAFPIFNQHTLVTASHIVEGIEPEDVVIADNNPGTLLEVIEIVRHQNADLSVLKLPSDVATALNYFEVSDQKYGLGTGVHSFGYPYQSLDGGIVNFEPRLFSGTFQRFMQYSHGPYCYEASELSFPAPTGLSGGPVFLRRNPSSVVGLVTANVESYTIVDYCEEHVSEREKEIHKITKVVSYGICIRIDRYNEWIKAIAG